MPVPEPGDAHGTIIDLLRRYNVELDRFAATFAARHDLHRTDLDALAYVWRGAGGGEPLTLSGLGRALGLSSSAATSLVDRLERAGHVARRRHPADRRRVAVELDGDAERLAGAFFAPLGAELRRATSGFSADELATVARFLEHAVATVVEARARTGPEVRPPPG